MTDLGSHHDAPPCSPDSADPPATAAPAPTDPRPAHPRAPFASRSGLRWPLFWFDVVLIMCAVTVAQQVRFGNQDWDGSARVYTAASVTITVLWAGLLRLRGAYDSRVLGRGTVEYNRVLSASLLLFGTIAVLSTVLAIDIARGYLAIALPLGLVLLLLHRLAVYVVVRHRRRMGRVDDRMVVLGSRAAAASTVRTLAAKPHLGFEVVAVCVPASDGDPGGMLVVGERSIPVHTVGDGDAVIDVAQLLGAHTLAVTDAQSLSPADIRDLGWALHEKHIDFVFAPLFQDYGGLRMHMSMDYDLPLVLVDAPAYRSPWRLLKPLIGRTLALLGLIALSPVLLTIAAAIKLDDRGPVFYRQIRVGRGGKTFGVWKFRSMYVDADARLAQLRAERGDDGAFYKDADDPRITRIGRFLRSTSLDELPQLINVLTGQMSLVGPRPMVPGEGAEYEGFVERRLLVRPGMTGMWQVSGRSNVSAEERVRLDLAYVENYSLTQDLTILMRTVRTVLQRDGAY